MRTILLILILCASSSAIAQKYEYTLVTPKSAGLHNIQIAIGGIGGITKGLQISVRIPRINEYGNLNSVKAVFNDNGKAILEVPMVGYLTEDATYETFDVFVNPSALYGLAVIATYGIENSHSKGIIRATKIEGFGMLNIP